MKFIIFSILFSLFIMSSGSEGVVVMEGFEQPITVCSMLTEFEEKVRYCLEELGGQDCGIGIGFSGSVPEDVRDIVKAFLANTLTSCAEDLQCILTKTVSAKTKHQCNATE